MLGLRILSTANPDRPAGFSFEQDPPVVRYTLPRPADNTSDAAHCEPLPPSRLFNTRNFVPRLITIVIQSQRFLETKIETPQDSA
jgi:hypothetical protein